MNEKRAVRLHERCSGCDGPVYRAILTSRLAQDDSGGGEFICTQVHDRCDLCEHVVRCTTLVYWPVSNELDNPFDAWVDCQLTRDEFNQAVVDVLASHGHCQWETQAS